MRAGAQEEKAIYSVQHCASKERDILVATEALPGQPESH